MRDDPNSSAKAPLPWRMVVAAGLLAIAPAAGAAQSIPIPIEKPAVDGEDVKPLPAPSCLRELEAAGVIAAAASVPATGQCVVPDPVAIEAVETRSGRISLPARPVLDCRFAAVIAAWLREVVSPVASSLFGSPVDAVVTGPGYQCRNRPGGKPSEHAIGNALDVAEIRLDDGRRIGLAGLMEAQGAQREFLRAMTASACGYFTTVLGPGSDAAHADHLHVDRAVRRTAEYRICMAR